MEYNTLLSISKVLYVVCIYIYICIYIDIFVSLYKPDMLKWKHKTNKNNFYQSCTLTSIAAVDNKFSVGKFPNMSWLLHFPFQSENLHWWVTATNVPRANQREAYLHGEVEHFWQNLNKSSKFLRDTRNCFSLSRGLVTNLKYKQLI